MPKQLLKQLITDLIWIEKTLVRLLAKAYGLDKIHSIPEFKIMIRVKATDPDAPFTLGLTEVSDSEGDVLELAGFQFSDPVSDNPDAVSILDYAAGAGNVHFGAPGVANLKTEVSKASDGTVVFSIVQSFEVSAGDPVNFKGGFVVEGHPDEG
jgi:hypothetical protein